MRASSRDKRVTSSSLTTTLLTQEVPCLQEFPEKVTNLIDIPFVLAYGILLLSYLVHWIAALIGVGTLTVISLLLGFIIGPILNNCQVIDIRLCLLHNEDKRKITL